MMSFEQLGPVVAGAPTAPVTILLVAPYTARGGGMGRIMLYLAATTPESGLCFETIESRGAGTALSSFLPFLKAGWRIGLRAYGGNRVILHVNMAERGSVLRKGMLLLWGRWLGLPTVLHLHAAEIVPFYDNLPRLAQGCVGFIFRSASVCVVLGKGYGDWLHVALGVDRNRIEVLANGVPKPTSKTRFPDRQSSNLLFLGNLQARKGLSDLLGALSKNAICNRDWTLAVAGGGNAEIFRQQAQALGLADKVHFEGWLGREACTDLLQRAGCLILPSYHEGLPLVLLEAASLGLPSITTPVGAIAEVFVHQETALFVAPGDADALSEAILQLMDDPDLATRIGNNARLLYDRSLSIEMFSQGLSAIYKRHCAATHRYA